MNEAALLSCPICLENLRQPVTTPCGHNFCMGCLTQALTRTPNRCPLHYEPEFPTGFQIAINHQLTSCIEWVSQNSSMVKQNARDFPSQEEGEGREEEQDRNGSVLKVLKDPSQHTVSTEAQHKQRLLGKLGSVASGVCAKIKEELQQLPIASTKLASAPVFDDVDDGTAPSHSDTDISRYFRKLHKALHEREMELQREADVELSKRVLSLQRQQNSALELVRKVVDIQNRLVDAKDMEEIQRLCTEADTIIHTAELISQPLCHALVPVILPSGQIEECRKIGKVDVKREDPIYFCLVNSRFVFDPTLDLPGCGHTDLFEMSKDRRTVKKAKDKGKSAAIVGQSIRPQNRTMAELNVSFTIDSSSVQDDKDMVGLQTHLVKASSSGVVVKLGDGSVHVDHKKKGYIGRGQIHASEKIAFTVHLFDGTVDIKRGSATLTVNWATQDIIHPIVRLKHVGWKITMT
eukprot:m.67769 g.67769  ORF g.67769 m.67769 type:complete len:463 (-) comp8227_c1_seq1:1580-2968(-)